jgi:SAM-dependent methyltransferase
MKHKAEAHPYRDFELAGWKQAANAYADTFEGATRLFADALLDATDLKPGQQILDVACGTGYVAGLAMARGAIARGADFSEPMLAQATRLHPSIEFDHADAEALPYPDNSFDAVVVNFGVHHFPFPERALAEIRRVLRPSGKTAFSVWASPEHHALQKLALEGARVAGNAGASLPAPPSGALNTLEACFALLRNARIEPDEARSGLVERELLLPSVEALIHLIESGTVRLASLIRSQPPQARAAILAGIEAAAQKYSVASGLRIPVAAVIAVGGVLMSIDGNGA